MKLTLITVSCLVISVCISGCTTKELYDFGKNHQKRECIKHAQNEQDYSDCLRQKEVSYEDYQKQRQRVIDGQ